MLRRLQIKDFHTFICEICLRNRHNWNCMYNTTRAYHYESLQHFQFRASLVRAINFTFTNQERNYKRKTIKWITSPKIDWNHSTDNYRLVRSGGCVYVWMPDYCVIEGKRVSPFRVSASICIWNLRSFQISLIKGVKVWAVVRRNTQLNSTHHQQSPFTMMIKIEFQYVYTL